jgi:hypothetical protein
MRDDPRNDRLGVGTGGEDRGAFDHVASGAVR